MDSQILHYKAHNNNQLNAGFTLLEVLIALTILAVAAAGLIKALTQSSAQAEILELKTFAYLVAENKLTEMHIYNKWQNVGVTEESVTLAKHDWSLVITVSNTSDFDLRRVDIEVSLLEQENTVTEPVARLTGFIGNH